MNNFLTSAIDTIKFEQNGLNALAQALNGELGENFSKSVEILRQISGRVIITGLGKSGHIGAKIAATLASTGTPSHFVHCSEANHGDLGMITKNDAIIALSWSGETAELNGVLAYAKRFSIPLIAITKSSDSMLGKHCDIILSLPDIIEACPHNLAPTTSSLITLALGDAIAIALLEARGFTAEDFSIFHPGGKLGAKLLQVKHIMHKDDSLPLVESGAQMTKAIMQISQKGFGCACVIDNNKKLCGIITDGDLRRHLSDNLLKEKVDDIMTKNPKTISQNMLAVEALQLLNESSISALMVVENEMPVGIVHLHDLLRAGVV